MTKRYKVYVYHKLVLETNDIAEAKAEFEKDCREVDPDKFVPISVCDTSKGGKAILYTSPFPFPYDDFFKKND